jgi:NAD(P)-dependent dehydrogenase (short-subunit alcohol dehydrogenase family)
MRILHVGATGTVGDAVRKALLERGHEVLAAHRSSDEHPVDFTDPDSIDRLLDGIGELDALVSTAGTTPIKAWDDITPEDWSAGMNSKFLGQVQLVQQATRTVRAGGSFTVITGILGREPIRNGSIAAAANGALEAWVRASAGELWGRYRVNAVSPTVLSESREKYSAAMPGYPVVDSVLVGQAFVRSVESMETGKIYVI